MFLRLQIIIVTHDVFGNIYCQIYFFSINFGFQMSFCDRSYDLQQKNMSSVKVEYIFVVQVKNILHYDFILYITPNLISWKQSASPNINLFSNDHERFTKSKKTSNIFNVSLSTIAENTKAKIKFSNKSFDGFLQHANENFLKLLLKILHHFLKPTSSDEIINLISSLNEIKSVS